MEHKFNSVIYQTGINWCVDVPAEISVRLQAEKGYIRIKGTVNGFYFTKSLVPVKNAPYRLFVNLIMMKGAKTAVGQWADFVIEQAENTDEADYPAPALMTEQLRAHNLTKAFESITPSRKKEVLRYLCRLKSEDVLRKHMQRLIAQLSEKRKDIRIP
eukprot:gene11121-12956_t